MCYSLDGKKYKQKGNELLRLCHRDGLDKKELLRFTQLVKNEEAAVLDVNCTDERGRTTLMLLCRHNQSDSLYDCVEILLQRPDTDVNKTDEDGMNALMHLCRWSDSDKILEVAQLLIANGVNVKQTDKIGRSALDICESRSSFKQENNQSAILKLLQQHRQRRWPSLFAPTRGLLWLLVVLAAGVIFIVIALCIIFAGGANPRNPFSVETSSPEKLLVQPIKRTMPRDAELQHQQKEIIPRSVPSVSSVAPSVFISKKTHQCPSTTVDRNSEV